MLLGVDAFAFGKEDAIEGNGKIVRQAGIILTTKQSGILRVEPFSEEIFACIQNLDSGFAKTRIEQTAF